MVKEEKVSTIKLAFEMVIQDPNLLFEVSDDTLETVNDFIAATTLDRNIAELLEENDDEQLQ